MTANNDTILGKDFGFMVLRSTAGAEGYAFDNLEISFVPEPQTYAAIFGVFLLAFLIWKKRKVS